MWESLALRLPWEQETAGSNPAIPTGTFVRFGPGRQPADHSRSDRVMLRVRIPPGPSTDRAKRPRGAARSARHLVKVEAVGSNPTGGAVGSDKVRSTFRAGRRPVGPHEADFPVRVRGPGLLRCQFYPGKLGFRSEACLGGWSNGKTPGLHPGDRGSIPRPVHYFATLHGRQPDTAGRAPLLAGAPRNRGMRVRIPHLPLFRRESKRGRRASGHSQDARRVNSTKKTTMVDGR